MADERPSAPGPDPDLEWVLRHRAAARRQMLRIALGVLGVALAGVCTAKAPGWMLRHGQEAGWECLHDFEKSPRKGVEACADQGLWLFLPRLVPWTWTEARATEKRLRLRAAEIGLEIASGVDADARDRSRFADALVAGTPRAAGRRAVSLQLEDRGALEDLARLGDSWSDACSLGRVVRARLRLGEVGGAVEAARRLAAVSETTGCPEETYWAAVALCLGLKPSDSLPVFEKVAPLLRKGWGSSWAELTARLCGLPAHAPGPGALPSIEHDLGFHLFLRDWLGDVSVDVLQVRLVGALGIGQERFPALVVGVASGEMTDPGGILGELAPEAEWSQQILVPLPALEPVGPRHDRSGVHYLVARNFTGIDAWNEDDLRCLLGAHGLFLSSGIRAREWAKTALWGIQHSATNPMVTLWVPARLRDRTLAEAARRLEVAARGPFPAYRPPGLERYAGEHVPTREALEHPGEPFGRARSWIAAERERAAAEAGDLAAARDLLSTVGHLDPPVLGLARSVLARLAGDPEAALAALPAVASDSLGYPLVVFYNLARAHVLMDLRRPAEALAAATQADDAAGRFEGDEGRAVWGTAALRAALALIAGAAADVPLGPPCKLYDRISVPRLCEVAALYGLARAGPEEQRRGRASAVRLVPPWDSTGLYLLLGLVAGRGSDVEPWLDFAVNDTAESARRTAWARAEAARWRGDADAAGKWMSRFEVLRRLAAREERAFVMELNGL
jgi:hypothetical protein